MSEARNAVRQTAYVIEGLARQIQTNIDNNADIFGLANELARNSQAFVFSFGELSALEALGLAGKPSRAKQTGGGSAKHVLRDPITGRFVRKSNNNQ